VGSVGPGAAAPEVEGADELPPATGFRIFFRGLDGEAAGDKRPTRQIAANCGKSYLYAANLWAPLSAPRFPVWSYLLSRSTDTKTRVQASEPRVAGSNPAGRAQPKAVARRRKRLSLLPLRPATPDTSKPSDDRPSAQICRFRCRSRQIVPMSGESVGTNIGTFLQKFGTIVGTSV